MVQQVKNPPMMQEMQVQFLGWDPLEKEVATTPVCLLENPMDRRARRATVHGVAKS